MSNGSPAQRLTRLLVCEGAEDKFFFQRLIDVHALPRFCLWDAGGNGQFSRAIQAFKVERTREFNSILDVLVVADNDETPTTNFQRVRDHIDRVFGPGSAPIAPLQKVPRTATNPSITVLMIPWTNEKGHLERLCVDAARSVDGGCAGHVDTFMNLIAAERWQNESRFAKAWLRTNLAARSTRDPFVALGHVFNESQYQPLIPVTHSSFNRIISVLKTF